MPGSQTRHPSDLSQCPAVLPSPPGLSGGAPLLQDKGMATLAARHLNGLPQSLRSFVLTRPQATLSTGHPAVVVPMGDRPVPSLPQTPLARRPGTPTRSASWGWTRLGAATPGGPRFSCSVSRKGGGFFTTRGAEANGPAYSRTDLWASPPPGPQPGVSHRSTRPRLTGTRPGGRAPGAEDVSAACT